MTVVTTLACPLCHIAIPSPETTCPRDGHAGEAVVWNDVPAPLGKRFRVLEPFAHGSTGSTYLADESESGRRGLLKVLASVPKHREPERSRLRRELTKQATLQAERLVVPWASGESEGHTWLFRPWLDGVSLTVRLSRGERLTPEHALAIAAQLAQALDELHRAGLLHRDVKPGHVFLQTNGSGEPRAHLIEAGVCASLARPGNSTIFGTPGYVAPEQLLGKLVSFRSDLYSLGCVMYEMLAGHPPFQGDSDQATMAAQLSGVLPAMPANLPDGILGLLRSLLAKEPQERPFSAQKLRRILDPYAPQGAPMTRQPTSTFATVPERDKHDTKQDDKAVAAPEVPEAPPPMPTPAASAQPQRPGARAASAVPPPHPSGRGVSRDTQSMFGPAATHRPTVRGLAPPPPPRAATQSFSARGREDALRSADPTQHLDLDQIELLSDADSEALTSEHAEQAPTAPKAREDHTVPIRLDQILSMAPAKLRASAAPPPHAETPPAEEEPEARAAQVVAGPSLPAPSLFVPATSPQPASPDTTMVVEEEYLTAVSAGSDTATSASPTDSAAEASSPLFGGLPEAPVDPLYANAFGLADDVDDSSDAEQTKVAQKPTAPDWTSAPAGDEDPTLHHPSALTSSPPAVGLDEPGDVDELKPRTLQDTLHPYLAKSPEARRKIAYGAGIVALLGLLAWGVSALTGDDGPRVAEGDADLTRAGSNAAPPPPSVAQAPQVTNLGAKEKRAEPAAKEPQAEPAEAEAQAAVVEPLAPPPAEKQEPAEKQALVARAETSSAPAKASKADTTPRRSQADIRRERREEKERQKAAAKQKKGDASKERAAKWAEARDEARAHYAAKRYKQAAAAYERASSFNPTDAGTFAGLGAARLQARDAKGAVAAYQRAVQLSPSSAGLHVALGRAYVNAGDKAKAKAAYKRALAIDPKNGPAQSSLKEIGG